MEKKQVNRENIGQHLLEYQLGLVDKDLMCLIDDDLWRFNNTLSFPQYLEFREYAEGLISKIFKCNSTKKELIFKQFYDLFGLRIRGGI